MKILVVGCGLSGSVIARGLADDGHDVTIIDRRSHVGGNMYDYCDEYGVLVQKYGPHTFHTNELPLYNYISKYEQWFDYKLKCGAYWEGIFTPTPFNYKTIDQFFKGEKSLILKEKLTKYFPTGKATVLEVLYHEDPTIKEYGEFLFKNDYAPYTSKQWGLDVNSVDPTVLKRVPLRFSYDEGYFDDIIQVMPIHSFSYFFNNLLNHPRIKIILNEDAERHLVISDGHILVDGYDDYYVIYSGSLDQLFNYVAGELPYRSLTFQWTHTKESLQPYPVVAYPQEKGYTRITDYSKLPPQLGKGSTCAIEYSIKYDPNQHMEPYYPISTEKSKQLYDYYFKLTKDIDNLCICGRLGDYKYYNMDQALSRALTVLGEVLDKLHNV